MATWTTRFACPLIAEQFMMIEDLYKTTDKLNAAHRKLWRLNKVNIEFLSRTDG